MDSGFDEGDFKKARGLLLSFSSILIGLWFFGADLKSVSVFGTTVAFTQNTQHVWLVAMVVNAYFLLRFYQHSPVMAYADNRVYHRAFENCMLSTMQYLRRDSIKEELNVLYAQFEPREQFDFFPEIVQRTHKTVTNPEDRRWLMYGLEHIASFNVRGEYKSLSAMQLKVSPAFELDYSCPYWLVLFSYIQAKIQTWIRTSHWTEYLLPYFWSLLAMAICISRWYAINNI
jgi:hypothetical protein